MVAQFKLGRILRLPELGKEKKKRGQKAPGKATDQLNASEEKAKPLQSFAQNSRF
jgi:hypothetical protein